MSLSAGDSRSWAQVLGGTELVRVPQPYCYRCMFGQTYPSCDLQCVTYIDEAIELALQELQDWGVSWQEQTSMGQRLNDHALELERYENERPDADVACRIGDDRFMPDLQES